jgi:hypothetical protein
MKQIITFSLLILFSISCSAQTEFNESNNGLIYTDVTIKKLKSIVDSLNLKFKVCDLAKVYQSKLQAKANYFSVDGALAKEIKADLESNMDYNEFLKKYNKIEVQKELLVVKYNGKNYKNEEITEFNSIELGGKYGYRMEFTKNLEKFNSPLKGKWVFSYYGGSQHGEESICAFYFTNEFNQVPLPITYAKMVQYSDCMVDTNAQIFYSKAIKTGMRQGNKEPLMVQKFQTYIYNKIPPPRYNDKEPEEFNKKYLIYLDNRFKKADSLKAGDSQFALLFSDAVKEAIEKGGSNDEFEAYVERYFSNVTALELKRNRIVIGGCSMDQSPRIHALNIAKLSAETINWEIFLRSHLDIMNDKFERMSDGSYAWGARKTYIKELEVLDINVIDLILGISLRMENPSNNHYYGNIGRLGRALAETKYAKEIENKMINMIADPKLDDFNRVVIYYLFVNYNYNLEQKQQQEENKIRLANAVKTMPAYLATRLEVQEKGK